MVKRVRNPGHGMAGEPSNQSSSSQRHRQRGPPNNANTYAHEAYDAVIMINHNSNLNIPIIA